MIENLLSNSSVGTKSSMWDEWLADFRGTVVVTSERLDDSHAAGSMSSYEREALVVVVIIKPVVIVVT